MSFLLVGLVALMNAGVLALFLNLKKGEAMMGFLFGFSIALLGAGPFLLRSNSVMQIPTTLVILDIAVMLFFVLTRNYSHIRK